MIIDNKEQIKLYLNNDLVIKYSEEYNLFNNIQDYCRFMFALGVKNIDKKDNLEKYLQILNDRKSKKEKARDFHFGQFNKSLRIKELVKHHFSYLEQDIEVFDCINAIIIKSELILEENISEHFWTNILVDLENF